MTGQRVRATRSAAFLVVSLLIVLLAGGCRSGVSVFVDGEHQPIPVGGVDFGKFNQAPRPRLGSLPYPGLFTLFEPANPKHLGHHAYDDQTGEPEKDRGILYTCRGGFIDLAHTRKSIDLCRYAQVRAEMALLNGWTAFRLKSLEPSVFIVYVQYPPFWKSLPLAEKKRLAAELSIRLGQRIAMVIVTWHEVLTWFGYQSTPLVSEKQSAFTYDDTASHAFGVMVGGRALRDAKRDWDTAVTVALNDSLRELGVVTPKQTVAASEKVEGLWWKGFEPLRRHIDSGLDGRPIVPWIVANLPFCGYAMPHHYELPRTDDVMGLNFRGMFRIEIEPNVMQSGEISDIIPGHTSMIDVDHHLPLILDYIRNWHVSRSGPQVLRPY